MPYTPPSQHSPVASTPQSPSISRSHSFVDTQPQTASSTVQSSRSGAPRITSSTSYLSRHRRTPSITKSSSFAVAPSTPNTTPPGHGTTQTTSEERGKSTQHGSLRQSPSPVNDSLIPTGAVLSPPDSSQNSSDDEDQSKKHRGRDLDNLAELQAAIRIIEQHRESSPNRTSHEAKKAMMALDSVIPILESSSKEPGSVLATTPLRSLTKEARRISRSRSSTEDSILLEIPNKNTESSARNSDDSDVEDAEDNALQVKPAMVRKKSGELVKPALRPSYHRRRPSSMPGTPTYSKAVHFDNHLEHVRHFLQVDKPVAVSAGSSPVETYESETDFPFGQGSEQRSWSPPCEWELRLSNFPKESPERSLLPIRLERVFMCGDKKSLIGTVAVANLAFHKSVVARFTLDYWKTTSEVVAEYNNDVRRKQINDGCDRFNFTVQLADQANLENKTLFFCVKYIVNGQEFWDNNSSMNFQVDFVKKAKLQNGKFGMQGLGARPLNSLPRSRPSPPISSGRPHSMPTSFDDFAHGFDSKFDFSNFRQPPAKLIGESPPAKIRLKNTLSSTGVVPDAPSPRSNPATQAFGNRYDFGASLSAAIQAANSALGDRSGLKAREEVPSASKDSAERHSVPRSKVTPPQSTANVVESSKRPGKSSSEAQVPGAITRLNGTSEEAPSRSNTLPTDNTSLKSSSYHELLDKYCFFGSSKSSPQLSNTMLKQNDNGNDDAPVSEYNLEKGKTPGSTSPSLRRVSPPYEEHISSTQGNSTTPSRSSSPAPMTGSGFGSRTSSPVSFGYAYHQSMHGGFENHTQTAIRS
ncbi:MAG: hypothetical protein M1827_002592 [Pycnora praestabilis]|nr:MAG: hypothetical protein M1827_002592 [Pycnora praestabilis]